MSGSPAKYWHRRVPEPNPYITDPIWPGDPFWQSKKYPRELRAKIAHEWHHSPDEPTLNQLARKYGVPNSSLTVWCYAYPYGQRELVRRKYHRYADANYYDTKERAERELKKYVQEIQQHTSKADPTWWLMGDPLPSRSASQVCERRKSVRNITLPPVPLR